MIHRNITNYQYELDILRALACFLVIWQHVTECYYIQPDFTINNSPDITMIGWINSLTPIEVPLFVMISGYFLLPMKSDLTQFFRKRALRVVYPFVIWCIVYAIYYYFKRNDTIQDVINNILHIPVNFGTEVGHLWFIYMILGLYILTPVISPWLEQCSKKQLQGYLCLWGFTNCIPYIHLVFPAILGECFWNPSPMLYYFTGFAGYYILGFYIRRYNSLSSRTSLILIVTGYLFTAFFYQYRINVATSVSELELVCHQYFTHGFWSILPDQEYTLETEWPDCRIYKRPLPEELCCLFHSSDNCPVSASGHQSDRLTYIYKHSSDNDDMFHLFLSDNQPAVFDTRHQ